MGLLDKLGRAAHSAARSAGSLAGAAIEIGKLNVRIRAERAAIEKIKAQMGDIIWREYDAGGIVTPEMSALCEQIRDGLAAIDILDSAVEAAKERGRQAGEDFCACEDDEDFCGCESEDGFCGCESEGCQCHTPMGAACDCEDEEA